MKVDRAIMSEKIVSSDLNTTESFADYLEKEWHSVPAEERVLPASWFNTTTFATSESITADLEVYKDFPNVITQYDTEPISYGAILPKRSHIIRKRLSMRAHTIRERYNITGHRAAAAVIAGILITSATVNHGLQFVKNVWGGGEAVAEQEFKQVKTLPAIDFQTSTTSTTAVESEPPALPAIDMQKLVSEAAEAVRVEQEAAKVKELTIEEKLERLCGSRVVTSSFNLYRLHPIRGIVLPHTGTDLGCTYGAPIYPAEVGTVVSSEYMGGYGNTVVIQHDDDENETTLYAHASELAVEPGQRVTPDEPIAYVGCSGDCSGTHLHFEKRIGDTPVNAEEEL